MWIESHPELEHHHKLIHFCKLAKMDKQKAIGLLHCLWWWATAYAENGDLSSFGMSKINVIIGLEPRNNLLIRCKFVDRTPYLRVHDWWEYYGRFLQIKYKNRPEKWQEIKNLCFSKIEHPKNLLRHPLEPAEGSSMTQDGR